MNWTDADILAIQQMVYGEGADQPYDVMKMMAQSAFNRALSGRKREFGKTIQDVLNKGYYAVKNRNKPYSQAVSGKFEDELSQKAWAQAQQVVNDIITNNDYGDVLFYFTPEEIKNMKGFKFNLVKPVGEVGKYKLFTYPKKGNHYKK